MVARVEGWLKRTTGEGEAALLRLGGRFSSRAGMAPASGFTAGSRRRGRVVLRTRDLRVAGQGSTIAVMGVSAGSWVASAKEIEGGSAAGVSQLGLAPKQSATVLG
ncbi:hypothetical protein ACJRO7_021148 [Eucalyptus globulus]|uniref:Uncharacterized protein n=1 Tax=Eucalyptus globulus TaxID=34317 RepID=A0ABD3KVJ5_EUCGL